MDDKATTGYDASKDVTIVNAKHQEQQQFQQQEQQKESWQQQQRLPRLEPLDGFRFLVAFWLVLAHNFDPNINHVGGLYERFCLRRYVAVTFFIVLSGFVSQYSYGNKTDLRLSISSSPSILKTATTLKNFYIARIGPILACYYATMFLSIIIRMAAGHYDISFCIIGSILSLFVIQTWVPQYAYFGNTPAWTISTLVAHWMMYPFLQKQLKRASDRALSISLIVIPIIALLPALTLLFLDTSSSDFGRVTRAQWYFLYTFPLCRLPDFVYGTVLAEIFIRNEVISSLSIQSSFENHNDSNNNNISNNNTNQSNNNSNNKNTTRTFILAKLSDLALPIVLTLIFAVPFTKRSTAYDTILIEATMPIFGVLIYGSSCNFNHSETKKSAVTDGSILGYAMSLPICRKLGDFSFQVYLWRWPLFASVHWLEMGTDEDLKKGWMFLDWLYMVPSTIVLYVISYYWNIYVDTPIRLYLCQRTNTPSTTITTKTFNGSDDKGIQLLSADHHHNHLEQQQQEQQHYDHNTSYNDTNSNNATVTNHTLIDDISSSAKTTTIDPSFV